MECPPGSWLCLHRGLFGGSPCPGGSSPVPEALGALAHLSQPPCTWLPDLLLPLQKKSIFSPSSGEVRPLKAALELTEHQPRLAEVQVVPVPI